MPSRRALLQSAVGGLALAVRAPAIVTAGTATVQVPYGVQVGDVVGDRAMIWAKADRAARMQVRWATTESMADAVARRSWTRSRIATSSARSTSTGCRRGSASSTKSVSWISPT